MNKYRISQYASCYFMIRYVIKKSMVNRSVLMVSLILISCTSVDNKSVDEHMRKGNNYEDADKYVKSRREYLRALKKDSTFINAYMRLGDLEKNNDHHYWAIYYYDKYIQKNGPDSAALLHRAESKIVVENFIGGLNDLNQVILMHPESGYLLYKRAYLKVEYLNGRDNPQNDCNSAILYGYIDTNVYTYRGIINMTSNHLREARNDFMKAIELDSTNTTAFYNAVKVNDLYIESKGSAISKEEKFNIDNQSLSLLNKAIEMDNNDVVLFMKRANIYFKYEFYDDAMKDYENAYKLNRKYVDLLYKAGMCKIKLGERQVGLSIINEASALGSTMAINYLNRSRR